MLAANAASWVETNLTAGSYNYRVRACAGTDTSDWSNVASVTIDPVIAITVTSPTAGQVLAPGTVLTIGWNATHSTGVQIEWSADDGENFQVLSIGGAIRPGAADWGAFDWVVPDTHSTTCIVRVMEYTAHDIYHEAMFSISGTAVTGAAPRTPGAMRLEPPLLVDLRGRVIQRVPGRQLAPRAGALKSCGEFGLVIGR